MSQDRPDRFEDSESRTGAGGEPVRALERGMTMQSRVSFRGGARIGWVSATFPFAQLFADRKKLTIRVMFLGKYEFTPEQVVSIETYTVIPFLGWGVRVRHNVETYPKEIIFWCFGIPSSVVRRIRETGFTGQGEPSEAMEKRKWYSFPVRWQAIVVAVVLWNALLLTDISSTGEPGMGFMLALMILFLTSVLLPRSEFLQEFVIRPDRSIDEIKPALGLLQLISGLMLVFLIASKVV
ncbi:MAG: hypothetical protein JSV08_05790 [Acidobacteriota bacterium]|nr:MAG: hypothetical protein JSV08_05790 [Acidobacteriota bacterium]